MKLQNITEARYHREPQRISDVVRQYYEYLVDGLGYEPVDAEQICRDAAEEELNIIRDNLP